MTACIKRGHILVPVKSRKIIILRTIGWKIDLGQILFDEVKCEDVYRNAGAIKLKRVSSIFLTR